MSPPDPVSPEDAPGRAADPAGVGALGSLPDASRRLVYVMAFRLGLVTFLLALLIALGLLGSIPMHLTTLHAQVLFGLIVLAYGSGLIFALLVQRLHRSRVFSVFQVVLDVLLVSVLVHLTGGINSAWTFLYPLVIVEAAVVALKAGALWSMMLTTVAFLGTAVGGFLGWLPVVADQPTLPWQATPEELGYGLLINLAAQVAIATLAAFLGDQLERASAQVAAQEETIRDMARLNAAILEALPLGVVTLDAGGNILASNPAAERLLGRDVRGGSHLDLSAALPGALPDLSGWRPAAPGGVERWQCRLPEALGSRSVQVTATTFVGSGGEAGGTLLVIEDQTEMVEMKERVSRAERLAAVGRLAAAIAHEIRNPLSSVSGSLEMLRTAAGLEAEDRRLLEIALREVSRLEGLISSLLDYARPRPPVPVPFDVTVLMRELAAQAQHDGLFERVEIEVASEGNTHVEADPDQVRQVLWNLIRNAAEAMPAGGTVRLSATGPRPADAGTSEAHAPLSEDWSERAARGRGPWVELVVADEGSGLDAEARAHLFEPFYTTKEKGTGLGLATVHRIVTEHGGQIDLESAPGQGTRMRVRLPALGPQDAEPSPKNSAAPTGG